ncbi:MAG: hypothetical protein MUO62_09960 [Anaerolineales bacterium]|nr:hypothetical protein [Anaerolineales bacterium]
MEPKWINPLRKTARIWSVVIIGLGVLVFIAEIFEASTAELDPYPWFENLIPLTLFLSVLGLALAWRYEGIGAAVTLGAALANLLLYIATGRTQVGVVALVLAPIVLPGLLFLVCWWASGRISPS